MTKGTPVKGRVLTPTELGLAEKLQKALSQQIGARALLRQADQEVSRVTQEINELAEFKKGRMRIGVIWAEAREQLGAPPAPAREDLLRGTRAWRV